MDTSGDFMWLSGFMWLNGSIWLSGFMWLKVVENAENWGKVGEKWKKLEKLGESDEKW